MTPKSVLCSQPSGGKGFLERAKRESESLGKCWFLGHEEGICVPMSPRTLAIKACRHWGTIWVGCPGLQGLRRRDPGGRPRGGCGELPTGCPSTQMRQSAPILSPGHADLLCVPGPRPWGREGWVESTGTGTWSGLSRLGNRLGHCGDTPGERFSLWRGTWQWVPHHLNMLFMPL